MEEIGKVIVEYYESLFTSANPTVTKELLSAIHPKVSTQMNALLTRVFKVDEMEKALK